MTVPGLCLTMWVGSLKNFWCSSNVFFIYNKVSLLLRCTRSPMGSLAQGPCSTASLPVDMVLGRWSPLTMPLLWLKLSARLIHDWFLLTSVALEINNFKNQSLTFLKVPNLNYFWKKTFIIGYYPDPNLSARWPGVQGHSRLCALMHRLVPDLQSRSTPRHIVPLC